MSLKLYIIHAIYRIYFNLATFTRIWMRQIKGFTGAKTTVKLRRCPSREWQLRLQARWQITQDSEPSSVWFLPGASCCSIIPCRTAWPQPHGEGRWWLGSVHGENVPRLRGRASLPRAASHPFPYVSCLLNTAIIKKIELKFSQTLR